jgi:hypothetical protein
MNANPNDVDREQFKLIMSELIDHYRTQGATGEKLGVSQQTIFAAKTYGQGSLSLFRRAEKMWRDLGYGPSAAVNQASEFARANGISEEVIATICAWRWEPRDSSHKIYMQMWAEHERSKVCKIKEPQHDGE